MRLLILRGLSLLLTLGLPADLLIQRVHGDERFCAREATMSFIDPEEAREPGLRRQGRVDGDREAARAPSGCG